LSMKISGQLLHSILLQFVRTFKGFSLWRCKFKEIYDSVTDVYIIASTFGKDRHKGRQQATIQHSHMSLASLRYTLTLAQMEKILWYLVMGWQMEWLRSNVQFSSFCHHAQSPPRLWPFLRVVELTTPIHTPFVLVIFVL
jgi:hypothetical protein